MSIDTLSRPLFCIADPELKDLDPVGHCLIYDCTLAEAARRAGFATLVLGRKSLDPICMSGTDLRPAFTYGMWQIAENDFRREGFLSGLGSARRFYSRLRTHLLTRAGATGREPKSLFRAMGRAQFAKFALYLLNRGEWRGYLRAGERFFDELDRTVPSVDQRSIIVAQLACTFQLFGWALYAFQSARVGGPKIAIILRFESSDYEPARRAFDLMKPFVEAGRVSYLTDSARLARDYEPLTGAPLTVIPIPHASSALTGQPQTRRAGPIRFGSLGGARQDKGFEEIVEAIRFIADRGLDASLEFVLQAHSPTPDSTKQKLAEFRANLPRSVRLVETTLDREAYAALLEDLDVVLLPYRRDQYPSRTSGVLTEALAAGKICIVTSDTWLSDELAAHGAGIECPDRSPEGLAGAILAVCNDFEALRRRALGCVTAIRRWHNADRAVDVIRGSFTTGPKE